MTQWPIVSLGEITESMKNGIYKPASAYADDGVACLRMYNIDRGALVWRDIKRMRLSQEELADYELLPGDLLVNRVNSRELVGKAAVIPQGLERLVFESKNIRLRLKREVALPKFVNFQLLLGGQRHFSRNAQQVVGMASISQKQLADFPVVLPSPSEQESIVAEIEKQFSRLDEAVANLKRVKANLKRYKAAVLKAAVEGRLVETEAELARKKTPSPLVGEGGGEGASYETGAQLLQRILEIRRSQWKGKGKYKEPAAPDTTDLPELPEGWVWAITEQLGHVQLGRQRSPKNRSKDYPVKYIRAANITERGLELEDVLDMEFSPDEQVRYRLRRGDLVLSEASGSPDQVGKPAVWQDQLPLCCFQNTVIRLRPAMEMSPYLLTCFQTYYVNGVFAKVAGGVGINHLSADKFSRVQVPLPPYAEQQRIVSEVDLRLSLVREVETQVDANLMRAERLRQSILGRAFSGKLVYQNSPSDSAHLAWPMAADDCGKYKQSTT